MLDSSQILFTLFATIVFCLGWRTCTDTGMLLYFIRKPFEQLDFQIDNTNQILKEAHLLTWQEKIFYIKKLNWYKSLLFFAKPFILCITCMASFWGVLIFIYFNGLTFTTLPLLIFNSISASFIQTAIYNKYGS